jgi:hypothetical protein
MKWTESEENLNRFFDHVNNVHPTIKFTHETSRNNISFLDTYTTCENGIVSTDIYNKPIYTHQYLSPQSCHPKHCTKSIRTAKLSESNPSAPMNKLQIKRLGELTYHLKKRGYNNTDIFQTFRFPESQDGWFFENFSQLWVFLYGCPVLTNDVG